MWCEKENHQRFTNVDTKKRCPFKGFMNRSEGGENYECRMEEEKEERERYDRKINEKVDGKTHGGI